MTTLINSKPRRRKVRPETKDFTTGESLRTFEAHSLTSRAIKQGIISRPDSCSQCGNIHSKAIEAHHMDYLKPLDVTWLCKKCHKALHKRNVEPSYINAEGPITDWSIYDLDTYRAKQEPEAKS